MNVVIGELVAAWGFRAETARDAGQLSKPDSEQLAYAVERGFCVVTHNRENFEELHLHYFPTGRNHSGVIISVRRRPYEVARQLVPLLNRIAADEMRNQLLYI